jgi:capsid assembly protease
MQTTFRSQTVGKPCWAIMPGALSGYLADIDMVQIDSKVVNPFKAIKSGSLAVLPLGGPVDQKSWIEYWGGTSTERFGAAFDEAMKDDSVAVVLIDVDSPGGSVYGVPELSDKIYNARGTKPIIAISNSLMASAAYWIASAADTVYATPSSETGSVGVLAMHVDVSGQDEMLGEKYTYVFAGDNKVEANPHEPLKDSAKAFLQQRVDEYYAEFVSAIARNRKTTQKDVKDNFGSGRVFGAEQAKKIGMIDEVITPDALVAQWINARSKATKAKMATMQRQLTMQRMMPDYTKF